MASWPENGQDHDLRLRRPRRDLPHRGHAVAGHAEIEQAYVGLLAEDRVHRSGRVRGLRADLGEDSFTYARDEDSITAEAALDAAQ